MILNLSEKETEMGLKGTSTAELDETTKIVDQSKPADTPREPDFEPEQPAAPPATSTALATAQQEAKELTTTTKAAALAMMPDDGFNDLDGDIGFGSFPIVKLDKDKFEAEGFSVDEFLCVILGTKPKFIYRAGPADDDPIFYSYDKVTDSAGVGVESRKAAWVAEGFALDKMQCKEYKEVVAKMIDTDLAGSLVLLSVPPASTNRLGGYRAELRLTRKRAMNQVVTRVTKGNKIAVGGNKKTFYPWNFKFARDYDDTQD